MPKRLPALRLLTAGVTLSLLGWSGPAVAVDPPTGDPGASAESEATVALAKAERLFSGAETMRGRRTSGGGGGGRDATLVLRDLARTARALPSQAERSAAARILARPTDSDASEAGEPQYTSPDGTDCGPHICVHWVEDRTDDSVHGSGASGNDGNLRTVPAYVATTLATLEHVYDKEVGQMRYRAPVSDGTRGDPAGGTTDGRFRTDVYLADVGALDLYGYCTSDDLFDGPTSQIDAYCVLDNDYAPGQFPVHTPLQNLQVTAAHEFFHAIQFAYDANEDYWLMEGTAAWVEDQAYDGVNDNRQYLAASPLSDPFVPLDYGRGDFEYGAWIFWRFLSESSRAGAGDDPSVVREVWTAAIGRTYSTQALRRVLLDRGTSFSRAVTTFGTWIRNPRRYFSEGSAYRTNPAERSMTLSTSRRSTPTWSVPVDHMSHSFARFTPGASLTGRWLLRLSLNLPDTARGSVAQMVVHKRDGGVLIRPIALNRSGNATRTFGFVRSAVVYLELDTVNASARFRCAQGTTRSCRGLPLDENLTARFRGTAVR